MVGGGVGGWGGGGVGGGVGGGGGRGYPQNAGVLVALVGSGNDLSPFRYQTII